MPPQVDCTQLDGDTPIVNEFGHKLADTGCKPEGIPIEKVERERKAAEQGDASAQAELGFMYYKGRGVRQNYLEAAKWYRKAAEQELPEAQLSLGNRYHDGEGVPQDDAEAVKWYKKAAEQGDPDAQNNLGAMYANGQGVPQDYMLAHKWFSLSGSRNRDIAEKKMTPAQVAEAQKLAREWKSKPNKSP